MTKGTQNSKEAKRQTNLYLQCLADISTLLQKPADIHEHIPYILRRLQEVSGVSRCYLSENHLSPSGELLTSQICEMCAPGVSPRMENPELQTLDADKAGLSRLLNLLMAGKIIKGAAVDFNKIERYFLEKRGIQWIMILPLLVSGRMWGLLGFDVCEPGHALSEQEIGLLETAANVVSASIERWNLEKEKKAFNLLLTRLAAATTLENMIEVVSEETDRILGWDAHFFAVREPEEKLFRFISLFDIENGKRNRYAPSNRSITETGRFISPILEGRPILINRIPDNPGPSLGHFGDKLRPSASMMFVPVRSGQNVIGILSIQSYTPGRYTESDLPRLLQIADAVAPVLERAFAEQKRRQSAEQMKMIVDSLPTIIFSFSPANGNLMFISSNVETITGYPVNELKSDTRQWLEMVHPEDLSRLEKEFVSYERTLKEPRIFEFRIITRNGETRWIRGHLAPSLDSGGNITRIDGVAEDITERKKTEMELNTTHQIYRKAIENTSGVPYRLNHKKGQYDFIGEGCEELLGISPHELTPEKLKQLIRENVIPSPHNGMNFTKYVHAFYKGEIKNYNADIRIVTPGGVEKWLSDSSIIIKDEKTDSPLFSVGILHDITERKRTENALQFRLDFEKLITGISTNFIQLDPHEINDGIKRAIEQIGEFCGMDRIYIFSLNEYGNTMINLYTWLSEKYETPKAYEIVLPIDKFPWWMGKLRRFEMIHIPRLASLPPEASAESLWLAERDVQSCIAVPMLSKGKLFGFLGFDSIREKKDWQEDFITLLKIVGEIFINAYERKRVEEALLKSEERYELAVRAANDGLWDWNLLNNDIYFSPRWKAILGYEKDEITNNATEWFNRVHPDDIEKLKTELSAHINGLTPHFENEHRMLQKNGLYRWVLNHGLAIRDSSRKAYRMVGSQTDVHDRKVMEEQLLHGAFHDKLTGLPNRALFMNRLEQILARAGRYPEYHFAVVFLDLDRFKNMNDSLGHMVGDQLLVAVAQRLHGSMRPGDTAARLGGDEFTLLLEDIEGPHVATKIAERILIQTSQPYYIENHELFITASIGIAISSPHYKNPENLLRDADTAMYRAKAYGRNRYVLFDETMHTQTVTRWQMEMDLRGAVNRKEFLLHYQPIIALEKGEITGFEALLRWTHPQQGLLPASKFISIVEETDLIMPVSEWVLREVCGQLIRWNQQYPDMIPLVISINLFSRQLLQTNFVRVVKQILKETGIDANNIMIDITESMIMDNTKIAARVLKQLKAMKIQLTIDDFGTGYSSLGYIRKFPADLLKIDRSFISRMNDDEESLGIVRTVITMARNMGLKVIAEGVETAEQLKQLRTLGCDYAQGFYFSQPLDSQEVEHMLKKKPTW